MSTIYLYLALGLATFGLLLLLAAAVTYVYDRRREADDPVWVVPAAAPQPRPGRHRRELLEQDTLMVRRP